MKIGTTELMLILVVALFVLGPEKMPVYAKKVGKTLSSLKSYAGKLTEDINENILDPLEEVQKPLKDAVEPLTNISKTIHKPIDEIKSSFNDIGKHKDKSIEEISSEKTSSEETSAEFIIHENNEAPFEENKNKSLEEENI